MATVPTFATWAAAENPTSTKLNTNIRDAGNFFKAPPACLIRSSGAQTLTTGVETVITMDTADVDTDTMADLVNEKIVIKTAGIYQFGGCVVWTANATGYRRMLIVDNTATSILGQASERAASLQHYQAASRIKRFAVNDTIQLSAQQASGGNLATVVSGGQPCLWATWIGA